MKVNFGGFVPLSTVDFPGYSSCVVFFRGCSIRCPYCHNKHLWDGADYMDESDIWDMILASKPYISGVAFSGGEPMEQPDVLKALLRFCKSENLLTCVHTSGRYNIEIPNVDYVLVGNNPADCVQRPTLYERKYVRRGV